MPAASASALVIGAGVVGHACALDLLRRGWRVTLVDPDFDPRAPGAAASWGNAGHIATEQVEPLASPAALRSALRRQYALGGALQVRDALALAPWIARYLRASTPARFVSGRNALRGLLAGALPAWQRLAQALGDPQLLREDGHWVCWESDASAARGQATWAQADTGTAQCAALAPAQLQRLRGLLPTSIAGAIGFTGSAQISDPLRLARALGDAFAHAGGQLRRVRIDALLADAGHVRARTQAGELLDADRILVCAGVRSRTLVEGLGLRAPLAAERGYHLQWAKHDWPADLPPLVFEDRSMIVTRFEGGLRAASFVELARPDTPPDPGKWQRLRRHVAQLGLPVRGGPTQWHGARPTLPDYLPAIGISPRFANLGYALGHQHLGLTLAAITGELLGAACDGATPALPLDAFDLQRFG
jgi:glycine/D-amino acid oxidase-like deaminating enzyme